jgi:hypothetical protein
VNKILLLSTIFAYISSIYASPTKIINGEFPQVDHPAHFNTVALVKSDGTVYCSGSIIGPRLILTAKHCLINRPLEDINIFFGKSTEHRGITIPISKYNVRYQKDWTIMFPSFDIAWIKIDQEIPPGFRPLPILTESTKIKPGMNIVQAGYGNSSSHTNEIKAGDKLVGETIFKEYFNSSRFFNILLFHGPEGQGSCHGDSGGPAYALIENQWYIIGVTNGFDVVLTPQTMTRTSDRDFPYKIDCSKNQSLYSFVGSHGKWIEENSQEEVWKSSPFILSDREKSKMHTSLMDWCESRDFGSPSWNLLKILIDKKIDQLPQNKGSDFYNNCSKVVSYLEEIESIYLNKNATPDVTISFNEISLLPSLKEVSIYDYPSELINFSGLNNLNLVELKIINSELKDLSFITDISVENLILDKNPLISTKGLENVKNLNHLSLSGTTIKNISNLENIPLQSLTLVGLNNSILLGLEKVNKELKALDLRDTYIPNTSVLSRFSQLRELKMTGISGKINLISNKDLEFLYLNEFDTNEIVISDSLPLLKRITISNSDIDSIEFLSNSSFLEDINFTFNRIQDLSLFKRVTFPELTSINLSVNPILDVSPLAELKQLEILRLFRTPLGNNLVPKDEANCPTKNGPEVLVKFCSN